MVITLIVAGTVLATTAAYLAVLCYSYRESETYWRDRCLAIERVLHLRNQQLRDLDQPL